MKKPCPEDLLFGSGTLILCERVLHDGGHAKRIFCSGLEEYKCWTPVLISTRTSLCTAANCGHEILPGHLMVKFPTTLHYECYNSSSVSVYCLLCEEEILSNRKKASIKICGTFGFKHYPSCLSPGLNDLDRATSVDSTQEPIPEPSPSDDAPSRKRNN